MAVMDSAPAGRAAALLATGGPGAAVPSLMAGGGARSVWLPQRSPLGEHMMIVLGWGSSSAGRGQHCAACML